ncbi:tetratricopeptide repeat protein [Angustibacter sp. Root456]|uniref:tetratricopeptide repeat protein n=1 Tax=Angustibacter sp. Root456 TaxID=1736539 RepID=UPI0006F9E249|nr:tetratricopeptide repeat protein [Angustibacter sp. Root456]KQX69649.1 thioredoxin [Angustibacter sp. Root456]
MSQPTGQPASSSVPLRGAVDLAAVAAQAKRREQAAASAGASGGSAASGAFVVDATEASFQGVVEQSMTVPVVVDLWAEWCGPCKQLSPVLERLAAEYAGRFLLAKVDVDANPRLGQVFQAQSIPTVVAIVKGQPVPLFQGALPEQQVRAYLDELLRVAEANGVTGRIEGGAPADDAAEPPAEPPLPPLHQKAFDAIEAGDLDAAAAAYEQALAQAPADADARVGLAQVNLMRRTQDADPQAARAAAASAPSDPDAQLLVADLDLLGGHVDDAFARLVETVRTTSGDERERVRQHLVELFEIVGSDDARVAAARRALSMALF